MKFFQFSNFEHKCVVQTIYVLSPFLCYIVSYKVDAMFRGEYCAACSDGGHSRYQNIIIVWIFNILNVKSVWYSDYSYSLARALYDFLVPSCDIYKHFCCISCKFIWNCSALCSSEPLSIDANVLLLQLPSGRCIIEGFLFFICSLFF